MTAVTHTHTHTHTNTLKNVSKNINYALTHGTVDTNTIDEKITPKSSERGLKIGVVFGEGFIQQET